MVKSIFILVLCACISFLCSCTHHKIWGPVEKLEDFSYYKKFDYPKMNQSNNKIRFDGFYYKYFKIQDSSFLPIIYVFFTDGTYFRSSVKEYFDSLIKQDNPKLEIQPGRYQLTWFWGVFDISNDTLKMQRVNDLRLTWNFKHKIYDLWWLIKKDTSLIEIKYIEHDAFLCFFDKEYILIGEEEYKFKKCANLPDTVLMNMHYYKQKRTSLLTDFLDWIF